LVTPKKKRAALSCLELKLLVSGEKSGFLKATIYTKTAFFKDAMVFE
jgi:hypothetical protein